jgi:hypothetical protein
VSSYLTVNLKFQLIACSTYPTSVIDYPSGYQIFGTYNSSGTCLSYPYVTWGSQALSSLTQPSAFPIPSGGDQYGKMYTIAYGETVWPEGWSSARYKDQLAWQVCSTIMMSPAEPLTAALVLTSTSISTVKKVTHTTTAATPAATGTTAHVPTTEIEKKTTAPTLLTTLVHATQPVVDSKPTSSSNQESYKPNTTDLANASNPTTTPPSDRGTVSTTLKTPVQPIAIGSSTVLISYQPHTTALDTAGSISASPAVIIGTQTVALGDTVTVNGVTVVATTGSNSAPQIVYGTTTVNIVQATGTGIGGYIVSGLGGPETSAPAQFIGGARAVYTSSKGGVPWDLFLMMWSFVWF